MFVATQSSRIEAATAAETTVETIYVAHHRQVFHLGLRYGSGNAAWAEDLTHDVFVKLAENIDRLGELDDLGGWLYRVASNLAISRLRRENSFLGRISAALSGEGERTSPGADVALAEHESAAQAVQAMTRLPARERVVLSMKILDDRSQSDIASSLGLSEGYVSKLVARGLKRLREQGWEVLL